LDWQSADKLKAVRLVGRQPIEAVDDRNGLTLFVACQTIESRTSIPIAEIWYELRAFARKAYAQRLIGRGIEKLRPTDTAAARQVLYAIIDRVTSEIALKAETHRARAEINEALTGERLLFDDSPEAERLRRFDLACGRGLARSLDSLLKLRRAPELVECRLSVVPGPLSAAGDTVASSVTPNATNEDTDGCEIGVNEPTLAVDVGPDGPTYMNAPVKNATNEPIANRENATNEPTVDSKNVTNEPTLAVGVGLESPTYVKSPEQNATSEPTADGENFTNEPTDDRENATNESAVVTAVRLESLNYMNARDQESTIEPALAALGDAGRAVEMTAGMNDEDDSDFHGEINRQKTGMWARRGLALMEALRAEPLRELSEKSREWAKATNAARHLRRDLHNNAKTADGPKQRATVTEPRTTGTNAAHTVGESAELVNA
jgi:hypothetical protein